MAEPACLLVLARAADPAVGLLCDLAPGRVVHAAAADLSRAGWRYEGGHPERATASAGGRVMPADGIAAVLCRIAAIAPADLPHVHRDDREYVAAEMSAFLYAWLAQFRGVRFNESTWTSLAGPAWHPLQWARLATRAGVPVAPPAHWAPRADAETATATVVGGSVFGVRDPALVEHALRIARVARSGLLASTFVRHRDWKFVRADPCPALDAAAAEALLRRALDPARSSTFGTLCDAA
jgi:hypothetical protein